MNKHKMTEYGGKFAVWDDYEDYGVVDFADDYESAQAIVEDWIDETDNECELEILQWDDNSGEYKSCN